MCGRFVLVSDLSIITEYYNIQKVSSSFSPNWNVSPGQHIPAIIRQSDKNILATFMWGIIPSWSKDPSIANKLINARSETVDKKPSFRDAFKKRRCLIVADGFYEWKKEGKSKIPQYFYLKSGRPFGFAGLYETWTSPDKKEINTCTILTTNANELIKPVHDRMPVILPKNQERVWLDSGVMDASTLLSILKAYPAEEMNCKSGMGPHP